MGSIPLPEGVVEIQGDVRVNGVPVRVGQIVGPGDDITAAKGARLVFVFQGKAFLVREGSRIELTGKYSDGKAVLDGFRVKAGKILSVLDSGAFRITTPNAVAGVRGTGIYVEYADGVTYVCLCYGAIELEATEYPGMRESLKTRHHESPRYVYGAAAGKAIVPATVVENHKDSELEMLEALVGRIPPFVDGYGYRPHEHSY